MHVFGTPTLSCIFSNNATSDHLQFAENSDMIMTMLLQLPVYKRDIRSVITASYDTAEWTFGGPCTLRCRIHHLHIEIVIVASTKVDETVIVRSAKDLTVDMIRSMTETGRRLGPVGGASKLVAADASALSRDFDFDSASPIEQTQRLFSSLKQQVCDVLHYQL